MMLTCYLHIAQIGRWEPIARELLDHMDAAGLTPSLGRLNLCWLGSSPAPAWLHERGNAIEVGSAIAAGEIPTLRRLHADCQDSPRGHVLYLHVKGASHPPGRVDRWRDFLAAGVIDRWYDCVGKLDSGEYDAAIPEWYGRGMDEQWRETWGLHGLDFLPHGAGNFWWSRADYVARLEPGPFTTRWAAEYNFIGTGNPRVYCPSFMGINWYLEG